MDTQNINDAMETAINGQNHLGYLHAMGLIADCLKTDTALSSAFYASFGDKFSSLLGQAIKFDAMDQAADCLGIVEDRLIRRGEMASIPTGQFFHGLSHITGKLPPSFESIASESQKAAIQTILGVWEHLADNTIDPSEAHIYRLVGLSNRFGFESSRIEKHFEEKLQIINARADALKQSIRELRSLEYDDEENDLGKHVRGIAVIDVDNTLIVNGSLNPMIVGDKDTGLKGLLDFLREKGLEIIIATGGDPEQKGKQLGELGFETPVVSKDSLKDMPFFISVDDTDPWKQGLGALGHIEVSHGNLIFRSGDLGLGPHNAHSANEAMADFFEFQPDYKNTNTSNTPGRPGSAQAISGVIQPRP